MNWKKRTLSIIQYSMKIKLILLAVSVLFYSCNRHKDQLRYNINLKIAKINYQTELSKDKFEKLQGCNVILFETLSEPKLYREINTCEEGILHHIHIDPKWIYNHRVGDTIHFDYLLKDKFFQITRK
jgi:hypothetical protein